MCYRARRGGGGGGGGSLRSTENHSEFYMAQRLLLYFTKLTTDATPRATEMDITMIGLQNAGKTSLLRVLAVRHVPDRILHIIEANARFSAGRRVHSRVSPPRV